MIKTKPSDHYFVTLWIKMRILKNYQYILSTLALLIFVNVGYANTTDSKKKTDGQEQEQEGRRKSDQSMIRPDGDTASQPTTDQDLQEETVEETPQNYRSIYNPTDKVDSVKEEESVSKYNFIFYFLYKFKYDGEESP